LDGRTPAATAGRDALIRNRLHLRGIPLSLKPGIRSAARLREAAVFLRICRSRAMGEKELREKYGGKLDKAINRAIRAEIPGGNEALDELTVLAGAARQSGWKKKNGKPTPEAETYFKHQADVIEVMTAQVKKKWKIAGGGDTRGDAPPRRSAGSQTRSPRPAGRSTSGGRPGGRPKPGGRPGGRAPRPR
jgi:hypothetical protein